MCCNLYPQKYALPYTCKIAQCSFVNKNIGTWGWPTEISCVSALCKCKKGKFSMNSTNSFGQIMGFGLCDFTDS